MEINIRHISVWIFMMMVSTFLTAQEAQYSLPEKFSSRSDNMEVLGKAQGLTYVHFSSKKEDRIQTYRPNMGVKWKKYVDFNYKRQSVERFLLRGDKLVMFYTQRKKGNQILFLREYNLEMDSIIADFPIDTVQKDFGDPFPILDFKESNDKKSLLIYFIDQKFMRDDIMHMVVFNKQLEVTGKGKVNIPNGSSKISLHDILVDNKGQVYLILSESKSWGFGNTMKYVVLSSNNGYNQEEGMQLLTEEGKYFNSAHFKVDNVNDNIVAAGFYTTDKYQTRGSEGIYYKVFNLNNPERNLINFEEFSPEFIARIKGSRKVKPNERLYTFEIKDILLRDDGGALLLAESFYKTYKNSDFIDPYRLNNISDVNITYHYDDLLVISVHPKGNIHWKNVLPKSQVSNGDLGKYSSFTFLNTGYNLAFIYNDEIIDKTNVIQYSIDINGEAKREMLMNSYKNDVYLMPQLAKQVSMNEIIIPSLKKRNLKLVKLTY